MILEVHHLLDPLITVQCQPAQLQRHPLSAYLYSGRRDHGMPNQRFLAGVLKLSGVHVKFVAFPGKHDWALWRGQTPRMIDWAGRQLARPPRQQPGLRR